MIDVERSDVLVDERHDVLVDERHDVFDDVGRHVMIVDCFDCFVDSVCVPFCKFEAVLPHESGVAVSLGLMGVFPEVNFLICCHFYNIKKQPHVK